MSLQHLKSHWTGIRKGLLTTIRQFSDEDLNFRPLEGGWSVAELILHIAHEENGEVRYGITRELAKWPGEYATEDYPTLQSIEGVLTEVHQRTEAFLESLENPDLDRLIETPWGSRDSLRVLLWHVIEHETHHRGELSLVLGLLGREGLDA